jgi:PAS domain S-box-containing protein
MSALPLRHGEANHARNARLRTIFDVSPFGIAASDPDGFIVESNAAYQRMLGYSGDELRRMRFSELSEPSVFAENQRVFAEMAAGLRDDYTIEKTYRRKDGATIWARVTARAIRDEHGELEYSVAMVEDITERRRMAKALVDSEERHRSLLEALPLIVYRADPHPPFATHYVSPAVRMLGYSLDEWLRSDSTWFDAIHPEDRERVVTQTNAAMRERRAFVSEYRMIARDGSVRWFHDFGDFLYDDHGPTAWQGLMLDITERKNAEVALKQSEELFRSLTEDTAELITILSATGDFTYVSPSVERILGWSPMELLGRNVSEVVHPSDLPTLQSTIADVATAPGKSRMLTGRVRHRDGSWRVIEGSGTNLLDHPVVRGIVSNARDVTDRIAAEEALKFQAHLLDTVEQAVVAVDSENRILYWNRHAEQLLGWTSAEAIGRRHQDFVLHQPTSDDAAYFARTITTRTSQSRERTLQRKDGSTFTAGGTTSPLFAADGAVRGVVIVFTDVTGRLQLEDQLRQSQKMDAVGKLAGGIAHDFNNLLTVIIGRAEFMRASGPTGSEWLRDVDEVRDAARRAAALTRQLLAFSRKQMLQPKHLQLNEVVDGLAPMLQRLIGEDIELVTRPSADTATVYADPGQLEQVLVNLVVNARDAMPHGGAIVITTRNQDIAPGSEFSRNNDDASGAFVVLSVTDTGVGMDDDTVSRIFEPFFTTKDVGQGTGLGLSMVYGIAKQSGGFITVRSRPNKGSSFELYLPAVADERVTATAAPPLAAYRGTETILLVEDSDAVRNLAKRILRGLGYTVLTAHDGREALELTSTDHSRIDLLLTDVVMPNMCGRQLAEAITTRRPSIKVLYMSGYTDDVIIQKGVNERGADFIEKPFTAALLGERVRKRLDGQR